jgi:hypothetical protein
MATTNLPLPATYRALVFTGAFLLFWTLTMPPPASPNTVTTPVLLAAAVAHVHGALPPRSDGDSGNVSRTGNRWTASSKRWSRDSRNMRTSPLTGNDGRGEPQTRQDDARSYLLQTSAALRLKELPRANRAEVVDLVS